MSEISLANLLAAWDGRRIDYLNEVFQTLKASELDHTPPLTTDSSCTSSTTASCSPISRLMPFLAQTELQRASSWLIKKALERGCEITESETSTLLSTLPNCLHWEAQLHLLQSLPYCSIPEDQLQTLLAFLTDSTQSENKMVRAWSYNAWYLIACQYPEYQSQVKLLLLAILDKSSEVASVKARIRSIVKQKSFKAFADSE